MSVYSGTVTGPRHKRDGKNNQDSLSYLEENDYIVIAVADGAGSLERSEIGSQLAASTVVNEVMDFLQDGVDFEESISMGIEKTREVLLSRDDAKMIGCTLAVAVLSKQGGWGAGIVGDAFAVISTHPDTHKFIQPESNEEFANVTKLLTSKDYAPLITSGTEQVVTIAVSSDGLENTSTKDGVASDKFWSPIIRKVVNDNMDIQAFLYYMNDKELIYDDTTLVIAKP